MTLPRPASLPPPSEPPAAGPAPSAAARTAAAHLRDAVATIDATFGPGYARAHPELLASLVQATVLENLHASGREVHAEAMALASRVSRETNETLLKLKPRIFG